MSNTAAGKTEICLQIELTKFQTICDKDEPLKRWCVRVCVDNCLPLRASPIPAVTKRIVGIFDVMAERKLRWEPLPKGRGGFYFLHPYHPHLPPFFFLSFSLLLLTTICLHSALHTDVSF